MSAQQIRIGLGTFHYNVRDHGGGSSLCVCVCGRGGGGSLGSLENFTSTEKETFKHEHEQADPRCLPPPFQNPGSAPTYIGWGWEWMVETTSVFMHVTCIFGVRDQKACKLGICRLTGYNLNT